MDVRVTSRHSCILSVDCNSQRSSRYKCTYSYHSEQEKAICHDNAFTATTILMIVRDLLDNSSQHHRFALSSETGLQHSYTSEWNPTSRWMRWNLCNKREQHHQLPTFVWHVRTCLVPCGWCSAFRRSAFPIIFIIINPIGSKLNLSNFCTILFVAALVNNPSENLEKQCKRAKFILTKK